MEYKNFKAHIFICTHIRADGESCGAKGSSSLRDELKLVLKNRLGSNTVRVNASGCLGRCELGITCVIYPQVEWMHHLKQNDFLEIEKKVLELVQ